MTRSREEPVPNLARDLAAKLGTSPPKTMRVELGSNIDAAVSGNTLYVTEGLRGRLRTKMAECILAHEVGHLAGRHNLIMVFTLYLTIGFVVVTTSLIDETSWRIMMAVALTVFPVFLPLLSRHLEYDADRRAASVVGAGAMSHALRAIVPRHLWSKDSETHPSVEKRLARLLKK